MTDNSRQGWSLNKSINLGDMFGGLAVAASMLVYATTLDRRVAVVEDQVRTLKETQSELRAEFKTEFRSVNDKLDRLIERQAAK
jgi:hypothetical protein